MALMGIRIRVTLPPQPGKRNFDEQIASADAWASQGFTDADS
jgi:hypothetical protein